MPSETLVPADQLANSAKSPFPGESDEYRVARRALLAEEIEFRRHMTRLAEQRRALPAGPTISKDYRFRDANGADVGLIDLFGDKDTLVTYFWMYGPQRERPCPMCTNWLGSVNGNAADIAQRVSLKILGRSPVERQIAFARERGWRNLDFIQTISDDYANDLGLLGPDDGESPALVVYRRDGDAVRLFWSSAMTLEMADPGQDPRDAPDVASLWSMLDLTPEGRGTDWYPKLEYAVTDIRDGAPARDKLNQVKKEFNEIEVITLFVEDLLTTKSFYIRVFESEIVYEDGVSAFIKFGNIMVNLLQITEAHALIAPAIVAGHGIGVRALMTIRVEDVSAVCARLKQLDVNLLNGPVDQPWGRRTAIFADPAGSIWEVAQVLKAGSGLT